jgi:hypothetical protein
MSFAPHRFGTEVLIGRLLCHRLLLHYYMWMDNEFVDSFDLAAIRKHGMDSKICIPDFL